MDDVEVVLWLPKLDCCVGDTTVLAVATDAEEDEGRWVADVEGVTVELRLTVDPGMLCPCALTAWVLPPIPPGPEPGGPPCRGGITLPEEVEVMVEVRPPVSRS
jgi:hypothetical protein